jgi:chorismate synthase
LYTLLSVPPNPRFCEPREMTSRSAGPRAVERDGAVLVRPLRTADDYDACVRLQRATWGEEFADYVPASLLKIVQLVGGVTVGAFTPDDRLIGFVFGLTGVRDGRLIHWSHMLAVQREYRDRGLGRRLKEQQRELLRGTGVETIYWTFDPLIARNAHLNLNLLRTEVREYVPDMYGATGSPLHAFGTDRFVVAWPVAEDAPVGVSTISPSWRHAPIVASAPPGDAAARALSLANGRGRSLVRIEIPVDIEQVEPSVARQWRLATRSAFVTLLSGGHRVIGFYTEDRKRCFYVLSHAGEATAQ